MQPPSVIDSPGGRLQLRELDAAGRPVQVTDGEPDGLTVDFGFISVSNLTSITEPAGAAPITTCRCAWPGCPARSTTTCAMAVMNSTPDTGRWPWPMASPRTIPFSTDVAE